MSKPAVITAPLSAEAYDAIREEIHRSADAARARMANPARIICDSRNGLMDRNLKYMRTPYKRSPLQRLAAALENVWAMLWAMAVCYGEALGLIEEEGEEE